MFRATTDLRPLRRSRRRRGTLVCAAMSYIAAVVAGYLALVAPLFHTGGAAQASLTVAAALAGAAAALLALDNAI